MGITLKCGADWETMVQHSSCPCHRAHDYAELAVSSPEVPETITNTRCTCTPVDDHAEWAIGFEWEGVSANGDHQSQC